jgi:hypothetical protein
VPIIVAASVSRKGLFGVLISCGATHSGVGGDCRADGWSTGPAIAVEGGAAAIAFDVHLEDGGVVDEAINDASVIAWSGKILPHSPNGWLAVTSKDRRSYWAPMSSKSTLVSAWSLVT